MPGIFPALFLILPEFSSLFFILIPSIFDTCLTPWLESISGTPSNRPPPIAVARSSLTWPTSRAARTAPTTWRRCACRSTPTAASGASTSRTGSTRRTSCRPSSNSTCPSRPRPRCEHRSAAGQTATPGGRDGLTNPAAGGR